MMLLLIACFQVLLWESIASAVPYLSRVKLVECDFRKSSFPGTRGSKNCFAKWITWAIQILQLYWISLSWSSLYYGEGIFNKIVQIFIKFWNSLEMFINTWLNSLCKNTFSSQYNKRWICFLSKKSFFYYLQLEIVSISSFSNYFLLSGSSGKLSCLYGKSQRLLTDQFGTSVICYLIGSL